MTYPKEQETMKSNIGYSISPSIKSTLQFIQTKKGENKKGNS
jgi:hypothetical protein